LLLASRCGSIRRSTQYIWYMGVSVFAELAVSIFNVGFGSKLKTNDEQPLVVLTTLF